MRTLKISSLNNFPIYHTAVITTVTVLHSTSLKLIYSQLLKKEKKK